MKKGTIFLNDKSGSVNDAAEITAACEAAGLEVIHLSPALDIRREVRERISRGQKLFVAAGGDGTLHHVAQPLIGTDAVLAILPLGTFNHFARDLKVPLDWRRALEIALGDSVKQVDTARVNDTYFLNNIMLGVYPAVIEQRERMRKHAGKWRAYTHAIHFALQQFPHVSLTVETDQRLEALRTQLFAVSVNPYDLSTIGPVAPKLTFDEGRLSVYWFPEMTRVRFVRAMARYLRGKLDNVAGLRTLSTRTLKIQSSRRKLRLAIDGELMELTPPLTITTVPSSLLVKVPRPEQIETSAPPV